MTIHRTIDASEGTMSEHSTDIMASARKALNALGGYGRDATCAQREVDARTIAQFILAERQRCADKIRHDDNRILDRYYCCSAMEQGVQVCGCNAVSIRDELEAQILASDHPSLPTPDMGKGA